MLIDNMTQEYSPRVYDPKQNHIVVKIMATHTKVFVVETINGCGYCSHTVGFPNNIVNALGVAMQMLATHETYWIRVNRLGEEMAIIKNDDDALGLLFQSCNW
jgi:hypothetical protein